MPLLFSSVGTEVEIISVRGTPEVKQHLIDMGFSNGSKVTVIQKIASGLIVKVKESRIALDKNMATKIQVNGI